MQLRSEREADGIDVPQHYTRSRSTEYAHPVPCSSCGRTYFADAEAYDRLLRAMEFDPDNVFICDGCELESEEISHS